MTENTLQAVTAEITAMIKSEQNQWIKIFGLVRKVEDAEMWRGAFHSATAWELDLCEKSGIAYRELQRYKRAGRTLEDYNAARVRMGKAPKMMGDGARISPRNVETAAKIAGGSVKKRDKILTDLIDGKVAHKELDAAWKAARAKGAPVMRSRYDRDKVKKAEGKNTVERHKEIAAADIILALQKTPPETWLPEPVKEVPKVMKDPDKVKLFPEFPVHTLGMTAHAARIDALIAETYGTDVWDEVILHGFEIKVSEYDLGRDDKMAEYADFCDFFWLAVTPELAGQAKEKAAAFGGGAWGVLAVNENHKVEVAKTAVKLPGMMKAKALATLVHKYTL